MLLRCIQYNQINCDIFSNKLYCKGIFVKSGKFCCNSSYSLVLLKIYLFYNKNNIEIEIDYFGVPNASNSFAQSRVF